MGAAPFRDDPDAAFETLPERGAGHVLVNRYRRQRWQSSRPKGNKGRDGAGYEAFYLDGGDISLSFVTLLDGPFPTGLVAVVEISDPLRVGYALDVSWWHGFRPFRRRQSFAAGRTAWRPLPAGVNWRP